MMKLLSRNQGFSLINLLVTMGIVSIINFTIIEVLRRNAENQARVMSMNELQTIKQNMVTSLGNGSAWKSTLVYNTKDSVASTSKMLCLRDGTPCKDAASGVPFTNVPFALVDSAGVIIFDATKPNQGLTLKGVPCTTFDRDAGNNACPLRYDLSWSAKCMSIESCVNPQVEINATLVYKPSASNRPSAQSVFNESRYSINRFYPKSANVPGVCRVQTKIFSTPGQYFWTVPDDFQNLVVETWGGGGGAAAVPWNCAIRPGTRGGDSNFNNGPTPASGGAPGLTTANNGLFFLWFCNWDNGSCGFIIYDTNYCSPPAPRPRRWQGENGPIGTDIGFPRDENQCAATLGTYPGLGGTTAFSQNGDQSAGSGSGTPLQHYWFNTWGGGGIIFLWAYWAGPGEGGKAGNYVQTRYTPATLKPGLVSITVGAGGAGGRSGGLVGGSGGAGLVKISWW